MGANEGFDAKRESDRDLARSHAGRAREALREFFGVASSVRLLADTVEAFVTYIERLEVENAELRAKLSERGRTPRKRAKK